MSKIVFTVFTDKEPIWLPNMSFFRYLCYGDLEETEDGKKHYHGYAEFHTQQRTSAIAKHLPFAAHIEPCISPPKSIDYCKKASSNMHEFGERKKQGERRDLKALIDAHPNIEELMEEDPVTYCRYRNGIRDIYAEKTKQTGFKIKNVVWIYGKTGTGKTMYAITQCGDKYWKSNKTLDWFDGYNGEKNVVLDEFRSSKCTYEYLLELLDQYPMRVPVKGSHVNWLAENIYITSPYPPEEVYPSSMFDEHNSIDQLLRRITAIINADQTKLF
jgi:hypothetical protein